MYTSSFEMEFFLATLFAANLKRKSAIESFQDSLEAEQQEEVEPPNFDGCPFKVRRCHSAPTLPHCTHYASFERPLPQFGVIGGGPKQNGKQGSSATSAGGASNGGRAASAAIHETEEDSSHVTPLPTKLPFLGGNVEQYAWEESEPTGNHTIEKMKQSLIQSKLKRSIAKRPVCHGIGTGVGGGGVTRLHSNIGSTSAFSPSFSSPGTSSGVNPQLPPAPRMMREARNPLMEMRSWTLIEEEATSVPGETEIGREEAEDMAAYLEFRGTPAFYRFNAGVLPAAGEGGGSSFEQPFQVPFFVPLNMDSASGTEAGDIVGARSGLDAHFMFSRGPYPVQRSQSCGPSSSYKFSRSKGKNSRRCAQHLKECLQESGQGLEQHQQHFRSHSPRFGLLQEHTCPSSSSASNTSGESPATESRSRTDTSMSIDTNTSPSNSAGCTEEEGASAVASDLSFLLSPTRAALAALDSSLQLKGRPSSASASPGSQIMCSPYASQSQFPPPHHHPLHSCSPPLLSPPKPQQRKGQKSPAPQWSYSTTWQGSSECGQSQNRFCSASGRTSPAVSPSSNGNGGSDLNYSRQGDRAQSELDGAFYS